MSLLQSKLIVSIALTACLAVPAFGVEMEDGPAYLTDTHGASGVAHAFLSLSLALSLFNRHLQLIGTPPKQKI